MADEKGAPAKKSGGADEKEAPVKKSGGGMVGIIITVVIALVSAGAGMGAYKFLLAPRLAGDKEKPKVEEKPSDAIPATAMTFDFPEAQTAVANSDPNAPTSVLIYSVSMVCENEETKVLVEKNKQWFVAMLVDVHRGRTREELDDPAVQKSIREQAMEEANSLLRRFLAKPNPEIKVIQVLHTKFTVYVL